MRKFVSLLLGCLLSMAMLAGCGGGSNASQGAAPSGTQSTGGTSATGDKTVVIWDYFETDAQKVMINKLIDDFNSSQSEFIASHVYVPFSDYEKQLTLGIASGELPDIVILDGCDMSSFIAMGLFGDITDIAKIDWDEYIDGPLSSTMLDGRNYGIPFATNCTALYYNKTLFDAANIAYPDENTTWDEFRKMAVDLTGNGVYGFGNAATNTDEGTFQCLQWLYTAGGSYNDILGGQAAYSLMQDMIEEGSWTKEVVNWTQSDVNNNFMAGNIAMQQNGPWQIPGIEANAPDLDYGVTVLPKFDETSGQATSILGGENMGVVKQDDMSGAVAFLEFYNQTEVMVEAMKAYGSFPAKTEAAQDAYWLDDPTQAAFIKQLETSIPRGPSPLWPSYSAAIQTGFQEVMTSTKTPEEAAAKTQTAVDAVG